MNYEDSKPLQFRKRGAPLRFRFLGLLRRFTSDSKGAWLGLDLDKISVTLKCSKRQLQRVLNEIRDEEKFVQEFVFRSANKETGRGRQVLVCLDTWFNENDREAFSHRADGSKRGLRESFQPNAAVVEGVEFEPGPSDTSKDKASKEADLYNTRQSSWQSLRALSFSFSRKMLKLGWEDKYPRLKLTINDLAKITHRSFKLGYWRDDVEKCLARAFRIADTACADGLARSPMAYAHHLFKLELKKVQNGIEHCRDRARKYWIDQVTFHTEIVKELKKKFGDDFKPVIPPKLLDACQRYNLELC